MSKKIIIANWKALPVTLAEAEDILAKIDEYAQAMTAREFDLVICPQATYLDEVARLLGEGILADVAVLGAQDMVSGLPAQGVRYVIIGHSDRRWKLGETDETVNTKLKSALADGLVPVVCLGERTRQDGWQDELSLQTKNTFAGLAPGQAGQCLIAYEPVWAISTSPDAKPDTPASAVRAMAIIRDVLTDNFDVSHPTFLYGGSVTPINAHDFLERAEIAGILVGGASVRPEDFCAIVDAASHL